MYRKEPVRVPLQKQKQTKKTTPKQKPCHMVSAVQLQIQKLHESPPEL